MAPIILSELNIYPIKSAAGIAVQTAVVDQKGLLGDRRWLVVNDHGKFMTQRQFPKMALIGVAMEGDRLILSTPGMTSLTVAQPTAKAEMQVEVWGDICQAVFAGEAAQQWLSQFLEVSCQLVYMPDDSIRPVDPDYAIDPQNQVSFADAFPFLLISEASLQDLNSRLESPLPMNRFRPNLVVRGCEPFAEDRWRQIRIGSVVFYGVKDCSRCAVTTVDQATGVMGKEPLVTLAQYRLHQGKILFGQNLLHQGSGSIKVGDSIEVIETTP
jgi:uncharacterized protein